MVELLETFLSSNCAIQNMDNKLLMWGKLENIIDEKTIDILPDENCFVPQMIHGTSVKAILRSRSKILILEGTVCGFNGTLFRVENIEKIQDAERRNYFRVNSTAKCKVCDLYDEDEKTYPAKLKDISISGVRFVSKGDFSVGEMVLLSDLALMHNLNLYDLQGVVLSKDGTDRGGFVYRCRFEDLSSASSDRLCKAIFSLQAEQKKERRLW